MPSQSINVFLSASVIGLLAGGIGGLRRPSKRINACSYLGILSRCTLSTWKSATVTRDMGAPLAGTAPWQPWQALRSALVTSHGTPGSTTLPLEAAGVPALTAPMLVAVSAGAAAPATPVLDGAPAGPLSPAEPQATSARDIVKRYNAGLWWASLNIARDYAQSAKDVESPLKAQRGPVRPRTGQKYDDGIPETGS